MSTFAYQRVPLQVAITKAAMFTNKHVVVALIVGPILAILAWLAVGQIVAEKAALAEPGKSYPLVEKSDCRYESGHCTLENESFKLSLSIVQRDENTVLVLKSKHPLRGVVVAVADFDREGVPEAMGSRGVGGREWFIVLDRKPLATERILLVASAGGAQYFGDAATLFITRPERSTET